MIVRLEIVAYSYTDSSVVSVKVTAKKSAFEPF